MPSFVASDGAELAYEELGPGGTLALVFVHGWQAAGGVWAPTMAGLARRHRCIAVDLRGFGASNEAPGPWTVEKFASDLSDLVAALDLDPFVVVGHSMGAAVAQRFAIDRPDAVEGLVLVAPIPASGVVFTPRLDAVFRATAGDPERTSAWLGGMLVGEVPRETLALLRAAAATVPAPVALASYESWTGLSFEDEAQTIGTPTLVLAPALDKPMTPQFARERVADVIEDSRFEIVPEAGHLAIVERPDDVATRIARFVDEL